ncbi:MAG: bifunctional folylpolyglutamate synthase/dihydrofolate synthase [Clostridia bacterium]|nr:bifunctional folylpolyglutamate synthase/dihydrofolate synthase [Clostridia bacterium]
MNRTPFENAAQAIAWIDGLRYASEKNGLDNMRALAAALGDPQDKLRCVHVAGTNGKGSTCALLERMLRECGLKTGLYTSPYLMRYSERMRVNGEPIGDADFTQLAERVREAAEALAERGIKPTWFELGTALALMWFAEERVDAAVIEVGLGGRLDATNIISPEICLIGPIGLEHTKQLGDTLEQIAFEKAGIIKPGVPVAVQRQQTVSVRNVFRDIARGRGAALCDLAERIPENVSCHARGAEFDYNGHHARIALAGRHQVDNACLALAGLDLLREKGWRLDEEKAMRGLEAAVWPARLEWLDGRTLIDGAHNAHGARALAEYVREFLPGRRVVCLTGMMKDKDTDECARILAGMADAAVATQIDYPRALPCEALAAQLNAHGLSAEAIADEARALIRARELAGEDGVVLICGSLYLAGDMRLMLKDDGGRL